MDSPFGYSKPVTGRNFYGRRQEVEQLRTVLSEGGSAAVYGPPGCGKMSLVQETLSQMRVSKVLFKSTEVDLLDVRDFPAFLFRMGEAVARAYGTTPAEYAAIVSDCFTGSHIVFDERQYASTDRILSVSGKFDAGDVTALLEFPYRIAERRGLRLIVVLKEFQNLTLTDGWVMQLKAMEAIMKRHPTSPQCSWIMTGSRLNAMKDIFEHRKYFYRMATPMQLRPIDGKDITDRILKGFLSSGKVVDRKQIEKVCRLFRGNIWHINHYISICDHMSRGYILDSVLSEALDALISINRPQFEGTMADLTVYQIRLLKAITEGRTRLSSADVIRDYSLNSSANVKRLKEALTRKEIITFDSDDNPEIIDPLFEYWVRKYFFHQAVDFK